MTFLSDEFQGYFSKELTDMAKECQSSSNNTECRDLAGLIKYSMRLKFEPSNKYNYGKRSGYGGAYVEWVALNTNARYVSENLKRWDKNRRPFAFLQDGANGKSPNRTAAFKVLQNHLMKKFPLPSKFETNIL